MNTLPVALMPARAPVYRGRPDGRPDKHGKEQHGAECNESAASYRPPGPEPGGRKNGPTSLYAIDFIDAPAEFEPTTP